MKNAQGKRTVPLSWSGTKWILALFGIMGILLFFGFYQDNMWPHSAIREAKSLIPHIAQIRSHVEENWELMNAVNRILGEHPELASLRCNDSCVMCRVEGGEEILSDVPFLSTEDKQTISALFTKNFPYAMSHDIVYTGIYGDDRLMRLIVCYVPEDELSQWNKQTYYMEELAPNWYACTSMLRKIRSIDIASFQAQREDGGLVRLP